MGKLIRDTYADFGSHDETLVAGTEFEVLGVEDGRYELRLADGRTCHVEEVE